MVELRARGIILAVTLGLVAACTERELILPGERELVRPAAAEIDPDATVPALRLPQSRLNADWTHLNGSTTHLAAPVQLAANPSRRWSVSIGTGGGKRERLISSPIVAGGVIYTLDAAATVSAVSRAGQVIWL